MRASFGLLLALVACSGNAGSRPGSIRRDLGTGGATSLPLARVSYGEPMQLDAAPPISLTTSDGTGLAMTRLDARAVVDGPLAFTELHLTFTNPEDRVLEGRFAITLPDSAAISRFAMKIDGHWMEAEMVERMAARRAYEDALHKAQDPALLEKEAGNEFRARVFPIPARADKELIISYSQELADPDAPFVLPLAGLPRIHEVKARIQVARTDGAALRWDEVTLSETDWQPDRDLTSAGSGAAHALGAPGVVAIRVAPELAATPEAITDATILVDTSASRALGFPAYAAQVDAMIVAMARDHAGLMVTVAGFDQAVDELYRGKAGDAAGKIEAALLGRMPLGASDLEAALRWAAADGARGRVIVVSDGVATAGEVDAAKLGALVAGIKDARRLDVVLAGGIRDRNAAEALARGHLASDGAVLDLGRGVDEVVRRIALATRSGITVAVDGARAVWPAQLDGVQPGDAAMIYAWVDAKKAPTKVTVVLGGDRRELAVEPAAAPLVERAAVQAEIARLEAGVGTAKDKAARIKLIDQIVALSTRHRVLSSYTALLVLETEDDYRRFGIDRKALAGILAVGDQGVEVQRRADVVLLAAPEEPVGDDAPADDGKGDDKQKVKDLAKKVAEPEDRADGDGDADGLLVTLEEAPKPEPRRGGGDEDDEGEEGESHGYGASAGAARGHGAPAPAVRVGTVGHGSGTGQGYGVGGGRGGGSASGAAELEEEDELTGPPAYTGRMATVMDLIGAGKRDAALDEALAWRRDDAGDVLALIALGEAFEADSKLNLAGRAYGSLIDLFPARADLRRFAGERLDRLGASSPEALTLAIDSYRKAVEQRPDHLTGHRLLAFALVRADQLAEAFAAIEHGLAQDYDEDRFAGGRRILAEDLGLVAAAWQRAEPRRRGDIGKRLRKAGGTVESAPSLRFVLTWETDANDVDFHIQDAQKGHAFYKAPALASGGELYADVTTGYGPECFTIRGKPTAAPYRLSIHYYSRGPMGYGMGKLEIIRHDGKGKLTFEERPFVVMNDQAFVPLGEVK